MVVKKKGGLRKTPAPILTCMDKNTHMDTHRHGHTRVHMDTHGGRDRQIGRQTGWKNTTYPVGWNHKKM